MRKTKKVVEYDIKGCDDIKSIVIETKRQKDILEILDERLENVRDYGYEWKKIFKDDTFRIEYNNGTMYQADELGEEGVYKKKGIKRIIYINPMDTQVFGDYEVNEYGSIS